MSAGWELDNERRRQAIREYLNPQLKWQQQYLSSLFVSLPPFQAFRTSTYARCRVYTKLYNKFLSLNIKLLRDSPSSLVVVADQVIHRIMALPLDVEPSCISDHHSDSFQILQAMHHSIIPSSRSTPATQFHSPSCCSYFNCFSSCS